MTFKRITAPLAAIVSFLFIVVLPVHAGINITPSVERLDLGSGKKRTKGQFEIVNTGSKTERYRIGATHFVWLEDGSFSVIAPDESSLAEWIKFSPKEFDMPPNSRRIVRYVIQPRGKPAEGSYWAAMELEDLDVTQRELSHGEATYSIGLAQSILVPIYAKLGKPELKGELESIEMAASGDGRALSLTIQNKGPAILFMHGTARVLDDSGKLIEEIRLDGGELLPWKKRHYKTFIKPDIAAGDYTLQVVYSAAGLDEPFVKELALNWAN